MRKRLVYFCPSSVGGIADYAHEQAKALSSLGVEVTLLCPSEYPHLADGYEQLRDLKSLTHGGKSRWRSRFSMVLQILRNSMVLDRLISKESIDRVIFATYSEYLAPLWAWRFRRHASRGVVFGAIVHDPVRNYQVGPAWWHRFSIAEGYSFVREAFVHDRIELDTVRAMPRLRTSTIAHGPIALPEASESRQKIRADLGIPKKAFLFLSFGHLRDGKNLHLVIQAMKNIPNAWLLVSGSEAKNGHRQSADYQKIATETGVADRCRWMIRYLDPMDAAHCFEASDSIILAYSGSFRSASGVLSIAAKFQKPVLVSCGDGNLGKSVVHYQLGIFLPPDDPEALENGMNAMISGVEPPMWQAYDEDHSWRSNAQHVIQSLFE
jgi:glycosyltransferase involved in cell wall biosynthesis